MTARNRSQPAPPDKRKKRDWRSAGVNLALLVFAVALLTLSFAPIGQFYLAWVGLAPWLLVVARSRSWRTALAWSWVGGLLFFVANMWWLAYVTGPGLLALMALLGLYWAAAGAIVRAAGLFDVRRIEKPLPAAAGIVLFACVWVAFEWLHGTWPLNGLPWLYLGHSQSPVLHLCQVADFAGVFGISFLLAMANAWVAMLWVSRRAVRPLVPAGLGVLLAVVAAWAYGAYRLSQRDRSPGPKVLVVQANYPQSNSGAKGAPESEIVRFHVRTTRLALEQNPGVNLVVWSETMMPPLNPAARDISAGSRIGLLWAAADQQITSIARDYHCGLLVGGTYDDDWQDRPDEGPTPMDRRNSAYLYTASGAVGRYDKIHLVPFGEYLPFKSSVPPLYKLFLSLSPYTEEYTLTAGPPDATTVFRLSPDWRFVTPICFEDIDPTLVSRMFRPDAGSAGRKRADFIVNLTNDGWFKYNEMPEHLQAAVFRSIENRAPTARSVNTGISGFVDSDGRTHDLVRAGVEGFSVATLQLDPRLTFFTLHGDVFADACVIVTVLLLGWCVTRPFLRRSPKKETIP